MLRNQKVTFGSPKTRVDATSPTQSASTCPAHNIRTQTIWSIFSTYNPSAKNASSVTIASPVYKTVDNKIWKYSRIFRRRLPISPFPFHPVLIVARSFKPPENVLIAWPDMKTHSKYHKRPYSTHVVWSPSVSSANVQAWLSLLLLFCW